MINQANGVHHTPQDLGVQEILGPRELMRIAEEKERRKARDAFERMSKANAQKQKAREEFMKRVMCGDAKKQVSLLLRRAAETGHHEILVLQFPSDFCNDGGVAINNFGREWPQTLNGFARRAYDFWQQELKPLGYKIKAQIISYPDGMLGDVGIFLSW